MKGIGDYKDLSHPHIASVFTFHIVCGFVKNSLHIQPVKILNKNTADNPKDYLPYLYTPVLFKLNRSRRLTSQIIEYPVDSLNLIYDSRHYSL